MCTWMQWLNFLYVEGIFELHLVVIGGGYETGVIHGKLHSKKSVMQFIQKLYFPPSQHHGWNRFEKLMLCSIQKIYVFVMPHIWNMDLEAVKVEVSCQKF